MSLTSAKNVLAELGCQVVIISFGNRKGALRWKEDTNCSFPIYLDSERNVYRSLGMKRSLAKSWSRGTNSFYVEVVQRGRTLITPYTDIEDDPMQMGGDILLAKNGDMVLKYLSKFPADRPKLEMFMKKIQDK